MLILVFFRIRRVCRSLHKWLGLGLGGLLLLLTLSGAALVCAQSFDRLFTPQRYAVTGEQIAQPLAAYAAHAVAAVPGGVVVRMQFAKNAPVVVWLRKMEGAPQARHADTSNAGNTQPRSEHHHHAESDGKRSESKPGVFRPAGFIKVYLDPPTGTILDVQNPRAGLIGTLRAFHTNLLVQGPIGRNLIGCCGIILLLMALSGLLVWWPMVWQIALRFRRGPMLSLNLHQFIGAWIALPLALIAFTGIYLAFPQLLQPVLALFAPMSHEVGRAAPLVTPHLDADAAVAAIARHDQLQLREIAYPNRETKTWRIEADDAAGQADAFLIDDATGAASVAPQPKSGDVITENLHNLHMNRSTGPVWSTIAVISGLSPLLFFVTGVLSWFNRRKRQAAKAASKRAAAAMAPEVAAFDN